MNHRVKLYQLAQRTNKKKFQIITILIIQNC